VRHQSTSNAQLRLSMRSEQEMYDLIINTARNDERIRAVILNGSRANPNAPRDIFQDFDIIYLVTESTAFMNNPEWIERFGKLMILQIPDPPGMMNDSFTYLMQFMDGNRIDLNIFPLARLAKLEADSLSLMLLDKDGILQNISPANESGYLPRPPSPDEYAECCNEFWWVSPYIAKGLWRGELIYAKWMLENVLREELSKMTNWYIGLKTSFTKNPGKYGKYFKQYMDPELWVMLLNTYSNADYGQTWETLFTMGDLFRIMANQIGDHFGFEYPSGDDERVSAYLRHIRSLPTDAQEIY
jgi:aminoglycoside 6-adenylyltransferase